MYVTARRGMISLLWSISVVFFLNFGFISWHCIAVCYFMFVDYLSVFGRAQIYINIHPDAVPPVDAESYHVATDKPPAQDGDKFRSILATIYNQSQLAERKHVARYWLINTVRCSIKRAPLSVSYYNEISGGHIWRGLYGGGVLPAQYYPCVAETLQLVLDEERKHAVRPLGRFGELLMMRPPITACKFCRINELSSQ